MHKVHRLNYNRVASKTVLLLYYPHTPPTSVISLVAVTSKLGTWESPLVSCLARARLPASNVRGWGLGTRLSLYLVPSGSVDGWAERP